MEPKERAKKFMEIFDVIHYMKLSKASLPVSMHNSQVKGCAIEAVNQIQLEGSKGAEFKDPNYQDERFIYWQNVKEELEKL